MKDLVGSIFFISIINRSFHFFHIFFHFLYEKFNALSTFFQKLPRISTKSKRIKRQDKIAALTKRLSRSTTALFRSGPPQSHSTECQGCLFSSPRATARETQLGVGKRGEWEPAGSQRASRGGINNPPRLTNGSRKDSTVTQPVNDR